MCFSINKYLHSHTKSTRFSMTQRQGVILYIPQLKDRYISSVRLKNE